VNDSIEANPARYARRAGWLYLFIIVAALFAELFVRGRLIEFGDAAATAHNILVHETLYRFGFVAGVAVVLCNLPFGLIVYRLLAPVDRDRAALMALFFFFAIAIEAINLMHHFAPLLLLEDRSYLGVFAPAQLQALAYVSFRYFATGYNLSLAFFGCYCLLAGNLIFRSSFLPRVVGLLITIAGLCYLINSSANFIAPKLAAHLPYLLAPCLFAETSLCLWLIVYGVDERKWDAMVDRSA
jgi:hypothetical protein